MPSTLTLIDAGGVPTVPWRNGGGCTRELGAWPAGSPPDAAWLRVSLADLTADGPFSAFPGVARWFTVVDGHGVELRWRDGRCAVVRPGDAPCGFDGADPPTMRLLDGPGQALNVMRRGPVGRIELGPADAVQAGESPVTALFSTSAGRLRAPDGSIHAVPRAAWALLHQAGPWRWLPAGPGQAPLVLRATPPPTPAPLDAHRPPR